MSRPARLKGYVLAEAMVSAAIASLAAALATSLLIWAAKTLATARDDLAATRLLEQLYEEARLLPRPEITQAARGRIGRFTWSRTPEEGVVANDLSGPIRITVHLTWQSQNGSRERSLEASVRPSGPGGIE